METIGDFDAALERLGITEYKQRIFNSNSHGELFHLHDYITIANVAEDLSWFKGWFEAVVQWAEENWDRPESIFQHVLKVLNDHANQP